MRREQTKTIQPTTLHIRLQFLLNCSLNRCSRFDRANYCIDLDKNKTRGRCTTSATLERFDLITANDTLAMRRQQKYTYKYILILKNILRKFRRYRASEVGRLKFHWHFSKNGNESIRFAVERATRRRGEKVKKKVEEPPFSRTIGEEDWRGFAAVLRPRSAARGDSLPALTYAIVALYARTQMPRNTQKPCITHRWLFGAARKKKNK